MIPFLLTSIFHGPIALIGAWRPPPSALLSRNEEDPLAAARFAHYATKIVFSPANSA